MFAVSVTVENSEGPLVTHQPAHWAPGELQGGPGRDREAEGPPLGIPSQGL